MGDFGILTGEAIVVLVASIVFKKIFEDNLVIVHIDNAGDCFGFVKGYVSNLETAAVISVTHYQLAVLQADCFFAWISTKRNIADFPTRLKRLALMQKFFEGNIERIEVDPDVIPWDDIRKTWIDFRASGLAKSTKRKR